MSINRAKDLDMSAYPPHGHRLPIIMKGDSTFALSPVQLVV